MSPFDAADLAHCEGLLREGSKSFALASKMLPPDVRERATVLYAFCRVSDDRVDGDPDASQRTIDHLRERLDCAYAGTPKPDPVDRAFAALLADTPIPRALPGLLLEGMEWDVHGRRYATLDDLESYAARVAGTVGAMMTLVMGRRSAETLARACDLGVAMQLTNVARDVGEDARNGRLYLPTEWLLEEEIDIDAFLARPVPGPALARVVARLLGEAEALYLRADSGVSLLPEGCRIAIRAARLAYSDIGRVIANNGYDSVTTRAFVSKPRKLWLLARSSTARYRTMPTLGAPPPPLPATAPLVAACAS